MWPALWQAFLKTWQAFLKAWPVLLGTFVFAWTLERWPLSAMKVFLAAQAIAFVVLWGRSNRATARLDRLERQPRDNQPRNVEEVVASSGVEDNPPYGARSGSTQPSDSPRSVRTSFRVDVHVQPHWDRITALIATQNDTTPEGLVERYRKAGRGPLNPLGYGVYLRQFDYTIFRDEVSGLEMIWSDFEKRFVEGLVVSRPLFESGPDLAGVASGRFVASPSRLGFARDWDPGGNFPSEAEIGHQLGAVPFNEVRDLLLGLDYYGYGMYAVKTFPQSITTALEVDRVTYDTSDYSLAHLDATFEEALVDIGYVPDSITNGVELYDQRLNCHVLRAEYFSVAFRPTTVTQERRDLQGFFER